MIRVMLYECMVVLNLELLMNLATTYDIEEDLIKDK